MVIQEQHLEQKLRISEIVFLKAKLRQNIILSNAWKVSKYGVVSGPCFPVFWLNTEIYSLTLHIHSEYRKTRIRNNSVSEHFSRRQTVSEKIATENNVVTKQLLFEQICQHENPNHEKFRPFITKFRPVIRKNLIVHNKISNCHHETNLNFWHNWRPI